MTRVSENSNKIALGYSLNKVKARLENLQMKGTTLKRLTKPSDDPISNVEALSITSATNDNTQYVRNANQARLYMNATEQSLEQVTNILLKAKEIAVAQSSDFYDQSIRRNVSNEIHQLRNQVLAIANKRIGNHYLFSGYATQSRPFDKLGEYKGDDGEITLEVAKDFFVPINLTGSKIFFSDDQSSFEVVEPPKFDADNTMEKKKIEQSDISRELASETPPPFKKRDNIFSQLTSLITGLENNDSKLIQNLLEKFDNSLTRVITLRTRMGSIINSIDSAEASIDSENIDNAAYRSKLVDADVAELFSDLMKQQQILKTTYKAGHTVLNQSLMDFIN